MKGRRPKKPGNLSRGLDMAAGIGASVKRRTDATPESKRKRDKL